MDQLTLVTVQCCCNKPHAFIKGTKYIYYHHHAGRLWICWTLQRGPTPFHCLTRAALPPPPAPLVLTALRIIWLVSACAYREKSKPLCAYREKSKPLCAYYPDALIEINHAHDISNPHFVCLQKVYSYI